MRYTILSLLLIPFLANAQKVHNVLIGTYTGSGSHGIYSATINSKTAALEIKDSIALENPSFLAFSPNKKFVYTVVENGKDKPGKVAAFAYNANTAKLTFLNEVLSGGDHPCHIMVHPTGKAVAVANYTGGNFSIIQIEKNGSLSNNIKTIQHFGKSIDSTRQNSPHVHQTVFSSKGDLLYVTDLGIDKVKIYGVFNDNDTIKLNATAYDELKIKAGNGPRHLTLSKQEDKLYLLNELSGSVDVFKMGVNDKYFISSNAKADTISKKPGSAQIVINKKNKYLYVSNRAEANTIAVLKVKQNSTLELIQTISTNGIKPRNFILTPNEKFILAANQVSNTIQVLKVNKDGTLISTNQSLQVPNPVCILID